MGSSAVVVGAGIAGLAAAVSLTQAGWDVTVLERSPELGEIGAGFAMSRNAVAAYQGLGFDADEVAALGCATRAEGTWDSHGRPILTIRDDEATREAVALIGVHRRRVHQALLGRARSAGVRLVPGVPVTTVTPGVPGGAPAVVAGREADLVVGADGMRSAVRTALYSNRATYSGFSSWRAIVPRVPAETTLRQYWGARAEFGIMPVSESETYWYGYVAMSERTRIADELAAAKRRFTGWADPIQQILARTDPAAVLRHDVHHLPGGLPGYTSGRVVMVGDAAHGFLPTMGQGVATALEDGLCVGLLIGSPVAAGGRMAPALAGFDRARRPRCRALGRASVLTARFGSHLGGGLRQPLRNALMRLTPAGAINRGADAAMGWVPPAPAAPVR
ncbi:FAD-dependent oxidoreductase [Ruania albidiflava]|uniref:FAD-dependent oxidoreductase n=1 Tax=Ruania albidiflava TaxID=366586 RepID=UPI0003B62102|nr:FAD-dependent oxidoreductase [Ruania albidiflava]